MDWMLMGLLLAATAAMIGMMRTRLMGIYRPTTVVRAELLDWYDAGRGSIACFDAQGGTLGERPQLHCLEAGPAGNAGIPQGIPGEV